MTLLERKDGRERQFDDNDKIPYTRLARMIGCDPLALLRAANESGVKRHHEFRSSTVIRRFAVEDFPRIVRGFTISKNTAGELYHPWAMVDTTQDFQIQGPSGATLVFQYPPKIDQNK